MNLYFIVEGKCTERKVYPAWIKLLVPKLVQVKWAYEADTNNFFLFNGNGYPALLHNHLKNSIEEVNELKSFKYLVLVMDVDESSVEGRLTEVENFIKEHNLKLINTELVVIPQNRCIETWFLGNRKVFKRNPQNKELRDYINFYDVQTNDPESMGKMPDFNTHSQFHSSYCRLFLKERNINYTKTNPRGVVEKNYLDNLVTRAGNTSDLRSFNLFLEFCRKVNSELK